MFGIKLLNRRGASAQYKRFTRSKAGNFFFFTFILAAGLFSIIPLVYSVVTSLKPLDELMIFPPTFFVRRPTFENFAVLPSLLSKLKVPFSRFIFNSFFVSITATLLHVFAASMAAFVLAKTDMKGRKALFWMVQFALLYNAYTLGVPQYLIFSKMNLINTYLVYILPTIPSAIGLFLMKQYMDGGIPDALMEASKIDGAGYFRVFFSIIMPVVKPAWLTLTLFAFREIWSMQPQGTIFSENLKTLPYLMSQITAGGIARAGSAMATTVILMVPPILVYLISQSSVVETMSSAGIKD